ncbi:MAG: LamG-like jellyroll fold domain-containing protein [Verrucomicrobiaceae bacterium]
MKITSYTRGLLVASGLIFAPCVTQAQELVSGLLNYWNFENNAEDTASDFPGSTGATDDDGTINGTVTFVTGQAAGFGQAGSFPGGAGNNITVADPDETTNDIDRTGADLSISLWAQLTNRDNSWQALVAHGEGTDYRIALRSNIDPVQVAYAGGTGDIFSTSTIGDGPAGDGTWHHIVAVTAGTETHLYIDGVLEASGTAATIGVSSTNANLLCIGCNPDRGREWNGLIDDVAMWDRPLTAGEVTFIYNTGVAGNDLSSILSSDDDDQDGLTNSWEIQFGLDPNDDGSIDPNNGAAGDPDMDGVSNIDEQTNQTFPNNADSDDDNLSDKVETNTGVWVSASDTGTNPRDVDSDDDTLNDGIEDNGGVFVSATQTGSNPNLADTDSDTMPDNYEVTNSLDPSADDSLLDPDLDTLDNITEFGLGTNPQLADTDADLLNDNVETNTGTWVSPTNTGTDPLNPDSDNDTLLDGHETNNGAMSYVSPTDTGTNPNLLDTDLDGFNDDSEIILGTDPTDGADTPSTGGLPIIDDFEDNDLNLTNWNVVAGTISQNATGTVTGGTITETGGNLEIGSRGYLVTRAEFDPELVGGIEINGELTFLSGDDLFSITTRSDAIPLARYGEATSGIQFTISQLRDEILITSRDGNLVIENSLATGTIDFVANVPYLFTVIDDGQGSLSMVVTEKDVPENTISITADLTSDTSDSNFVVFYNRENGRTSSLQEVSIKSATTNVQAEITDISFDPSTGENGTFSITWRSSLNAKYALFFSTDLENWDFELNDDIDGLEGTTTETFPNPAPEEDSLFFRIEPPRQ